MNTDRANLHASWDATTRDLTAARRLLPKEPLSSDDGATLENFEQFLKHNELALALDEIIGLGAKNSAPLQFWQLLKLAADRMSADQTEIDRHLRGS